MKIILSLFAVLLFCGTASADVFTATPAGVSIDVPKVEVSSTVMTLGGLGLGAWFLKGGSISSLLSWVLGLFGMGQQSSTLKILQSIATLIDAIPALGSQVGNIWEQIQKTGFPVTGRIFLKWSDGKEIPITWGDTPTP